MNDTFDFQNQTILIIDDEPNTQEFLAYCLEAYNFEIMLAERGKTGIDMALSIQPDLILLDVRMPDMDGFETCCRLKADEQTKDIPVLFLTALAGLKDKLKGFDVGGVDYITKPFEEKEVIARVKTHLNLRNLQKSFQQTAAKHQRIEKALKDVVTAVASKVRDNFFNEMVKQLAKTLEADYTFIGELIEAETLSIKTLSVCVDGEIADNFEYKLAHTPCENVVGKDVCYYTDGIRQSFPQDILLQEMNIEGYVGVPLFDSQNQPLGIMVAWYRLPISDPKFTQSILQIFAVRTAAEIERTRAEEKLRHLSSAVEQSHNTIVITDLNGSIEFVNPAFTRTSGYSSEEVIGKNINILKSGKTPFETYKNLWNTVTTGKVWQGEFINKRKNGDLYWETGTISPIKNEAGQMTHYIGVKEDITLCKQAKKDLKQAKQAAEAANMAKSYFLANMSHDIRTPMNAIIGFTELALKTKLTTKQQDYLSSIESSSQLLRNIINNILDFSKIEAGRLTMESINFCLDEVLDKLFDILGLRIEEKGLQLFPTIDKKVPRYLIGDPLRLEQIFMNILTNAIKFTEQGDIVLKIELVELESKQVKLRFSVIDTGIGISSKAIPHLFEAFTQADGSTIRKFGGTGLGLAICKHLTKMMDGDIWVESQLGKGSTFSFTAKFDRQVGNTESKFLHQPESITLQTKSILQGARILLVEDNFLNQQVAQEIMEQFNLVVEIANNGKEAVAAIANADFDAVLMDVQMPKMNGLDATQLIRENPEHSELPIIAMTAYAMSGDREKCMEAGMNDYLTKPIDETLLLSTLGKWIKPKKRELISIKQSHPKVDDKTRMSDELLGIDMAAGLKRLGGNRSLYQKLLLNFYKDYHDINEKLNDALGNCELETAMRIAHSVKGVAANLSINSLYQASKAVEMVLRAGDKVSPELLKQFEEAVAEVMKTLAAFDKTPEEEFSGEKTDIAALMPLLGELDKLLNEGNYRTIDMLPNIKCHLSSNLQPFYRQLEEYIENYEFEKAEKRLAELISKLS